MEEVDMPRQPRMLIDGGYYHLVTRGIDRRKLFRHKHDYEFFSEVIKKYLPKFKLDIVHYCFMPNHIHLLVFLRQREDLAKFMQIVLQVYANYYRRKYHSAGFIFQNRYKSRFINSDVYLLECGRYIERNPLRAKITEDLLDYPWDSFSFYARGKDDGIIKFANPTYIGLGVTGQERQTEYARRTLEARPYEEIIDKEFRIK
jgi:putative transposase